MREADLEARNLATLRGNISLLVSLGLTIDAVLASATLTRDTDAVSLLPFIVALGLSILFLLAGVFLLRLRKDVRPWPDGKVIGLVTSMPTADGQRVLIHEFSDALEKMREQVGQLQKGVALLVFCISVGGWSWRPSDNKRQRAAESINSSKFQPSDDGTIHTGNHASGDVHPDDLFSDNRHDEALTSTGATPTDAKGRLSRRWPRRLRAGKRT